MADEENEEIEVIFVGEEDLNEEAVTHLVSVLGNDETLVAVAGFDFESKVLVITDLRVLILGASGVLNILNHDDIARMSRYGRDLVIKTARGYEHRYGFGKGETVEELVEISHHLHTIHAGPDEEYDQEEELTESEGDRPSLFGRVLGGIDSAKQQVSRSVDVLSGADIRRFDEFTDATTRAVVGVHQDVSELQGEVVRVQGVVDDMRASQQRQTERIERLEQIDRRTSLTPWIAGAAALALVLSIVAVVLSAS